ALLKNQEFSIEKDIIQLCYDLIEILKKWTENLKIPPLRIYGIKEEHLEKIVKGTSLKNNPVRLDKEDITEIILKRL
ncbi:MAG: hypothetical protein ACFFKA_04725, partial [Candidatus Thorarchaeota archaeon]